MYWGVKRRYVEYIIYTLFWGTLIMLPFIGELINGNIVGVDWNKVFNSWLFISPAFILFVINNNILMPYFLYKRGRTQYVILLILATVFFYFLYVMVQNSFKGDNEPEPYWDRWNSRIERMERGRKPEHGLTERKGGKHVPPPRVVARVKYYKVQKAPYESLIFNKQKVYSVKLDKPKRPSDFLLSSILHPYSVQFLLIVFVLMFNISIRLLFYTIRNEARLKELEQQKLKSELEYLKFQINPHFFMNTLNNIHALIDIDKGSAQKSIIELAKMMRYVLYESPEAFVSLDKELQMIKSYITLMRLRYTDMLKIELSFPNDIMGANIPSLMLMSFVENAFKHGISYNNPSEVYVSVYIDNGNIVFTCRNTINSVENVQNKGDIPGIGFDNTRKRLKLLYGENYTLKIWRSDNYYNVLLKIPLRND